MLPQCASTDRKLDFGLALGLARGSARGAGGFHSPADKPALGHIGNARESRTGVEGLEWGHFPFHVFRRREYIGSEGRTMETKLSDEQLMGSLAGGDDSALGDLMKRWETRVLCFVSRMCGYLGKAEDICQDIWTRVFLSRSRFDRTRPFAPFLFSVATNCCRTEISRGRVFLYGPSWRVELVQQADDDPSVLSNMVWREQCEALHHAIYRLPEMQRAVVLLYLLMDGSYRQVAQTLVISEATARSHMSHAIRALRGRLDHMSGDFASEPEPEVKHDRSN